MGHSRTSRDLAELVEPAGGVQQGRARRDGRPVGLAGLQPTAGNAAVVRLLSTGELLDATKQPAVARRGCPPGTLAPPGTGARSVDAPLPVRRTARAGSPSVSITPSVAAHTATVQRGLFSTAPDPVKEKEKQQKKDEKERKRQETKATKARHKANKAGESAERRRLQAERRVGQAKRVELTSDVTGGPDKLDGTKMKALADRFQAAVDAEQQRIKDLIARGLPEANARDQAYQDVWMGAPEDLRALRPPRETPAEQLQREVDAFRSDYKGDLDREAAYERQVKLGKLLSAKLEAVYEDQEALVAELMAKGSGRDAAEKQAETEIWAKVPDKLRAKRPSAGSKLDLQARTEARERLAVRKLLPAPVKKGKAAKALGAASAAGGALSPLASGTEELGKRLVDVGDIVKYDHSTLKTASKEILQDPGDVLDGIGTMMSSAFSLLGAVNDLAKLVSDYGSGERSRLDIHDVARAVNGSVGMVNSAAGSLEAAVKTVGDFSAVVADTASMFVPGLSIGTTLLSSVSLAFDLASVSVRLAKVNGGLYDARARGANPSRVDALINPLLNLQSVFAKRVEKSTFDLSATLVKLAASIAEVASAGGYGVPAAVKLGTSLTQLAHSVGHSVANSVLAWQGSKAREHWVGRLEGSAEETQRRNTTIAVDALIVRARKGDDVARAFLRTYNLTDEQIDKKAPSDLHNRVMSDIGAEEDPKTIIERFENSYKKVVGAGKAIDEKAGDVAALRKARNAADGKQRGTAWEAKMFLKAVFNSSSFERSKHKTEVETGKKLHEETTTGPTISDPTLVSGTFSGILSIAGGVVLTERSNEATRAKWSEAVAKMSLEDLQKAAAAPYHKEEFKDFFSGWVEMRLHEEALRKKAAPKAKLAGVGA